MTVSSFKFSGYSAIVTGGTRGIGRALVKRIAADGGSVTFNYLTSQDAAESIVEEIGRSGGNAQALRSDVRESLDVKSLVEAATKKYAGIDILINNAHAPYTSKPFEECTWQDFQREFDGLIKGSFNLVTAALPFLKKSKKGGVIINIGSSMIHKAIPNHSFYVVAKHALWGFTESLAMELGKYGIRVNMITPGPLETDHNAKLSQEFMSNLANRTPLGNRMGTCEEVASAIMLLAGPEASFVTGANLDVTGGL